MPLVQDLPPNVEVTLREAGDRKLLFVLNTDAEPMNVAGIPAGTDLLAGRPIEGTLSLEPYGCAIVKLA